MLAGITPADLVELTSAKQDQDSAKSEEPAPGAPASKPAPGPASVGPAAQPPGTGSILDVEA